MRSTVTYTEWHMHRIHNDQTPDVKSTRCGDPDTVSAKSTIADTAGRVVHFQNNISGRIDESKLLGRRYVLTNIEHVSCCIDVDA